MKNFFIFIVVAVVLLVGGAIWSKQAQESDPDLISSNGLHWHPLLTVNVKGMKQEMPANLGILGSTMGPIHTHEPSGEIHLEFPGVVRKEQITLGQFFKTWGKEFNSFGSNVKMTVNGKENTEYENYVMQDMDNIELSYE